MILHCLHTSIPARKLVKEHHYQTFEHFLQKVMAEGGSAGGWSTIESDEVCQSELNIQAQALTCGGRVCSRH
jgi:hypothetical protein